MSDLMCACGGKCSGECRKTNLNRPRTVNLKACPAAYEKPVKRVYVRKEEENLEDY